MKTRLVPGLLVLLASAVISPASVSRQTPVAASGRTPVVLDTDIGDDIDDTWALTLLLKSPELDLKLVTTTFGKAEYRARLAARLLTAAGRTDVPIGLGAGGRDGTGAQAAWVADYDLSRYAGKVHPDGVKALIDAINGSPVPLTVISIGPSDTVAAALARDPGIAAKAVFAGMQGSLRAGYDGGPVSAEWNVKCNVPAARRALLAPWKRTVITPLDTCGLVRLRGAKYMALLSLRDPMIAALLENYRLWAGKASLAELSESSVLFDTAAVALVIPAAAALMGFEDLTVGVTAEGLTKLDPAGRRMSAATSWKDLGGFEDFLLRRLSTPAASR